MNDWDSFVQDCLSCRKCPLFENRNQVVIGRGTNLSSPILFIGEGPGEQEDIIGEAFVGRAGKLLDLALEALLFTPDQYYIANIVKCRPPNNRVPSEEEALSCLPYLRFQVKHIRPAIIVCLGATAAKYIIDKDFRITKQRGVWIDKPGHFLIMPTYHPSAVLRDPSKKKDLFTDLISVRTKLEEIGKLECDK